MPKLKEARCVICKNRILRHDALRVSIKVGQGSNRQGVYKLAHLKCVQETNDA